MAELAHNLGYLGGFNDGQSRSQANMLGMSQQWLRSCLGRVVRDVLVMAEVDT